MNAFKSIAISLSHACRGFIHAIKTERNLRVECVIAIIVVVVGILLSLSMVEWILVVASIFLVIVCELINTSLETLADIVNGKHDPRIKIVKDTAAASVFLACLVAVVTGVIVFGERILSVIKK